MIPLLKYFTIGYSHGTLFLVTSCLYDPIFCITLQILSAIYSDIQNVAIMVKYKGYHGKVEFDVEAGLFHGEGVYLLGVITFQG